MFNASCNLLLFNTLHPNISTHSLYCSPCIFQGTDKENLFNYQELLCYWSFPLFLYPQCVVQGWNCEGRYKVLVTLWGQRVNSQKLHGNVTSPSSFNPLTCKSDWHLISPYHITPESNIKVRRIKMLITH